MIERFRALAFRAVGYINGIFVFSNVVDSGVGGCYV